MSFAFFDLDHTLLPFDTQALFCDFVLKKERWRTAMHLTFAPVAILKGLRIVRTVTAKRAFLNYLVGMKRETLAAYAKEFAEQTVKRAVYPEMLAIIEGHRAAGRMLILNTASPDFYAHDIARVLGFDHCIATRVEVPAKMPLMPRVIGENNKHEAKITRMKEEILEVAVAVSSAGLKMLDVLGGCDEDLRDSWSYSDSAADLPLLEFAGHAVLVHPNASLAAIGKERGWQILTPQRPYSDKLGDMSCVLRQMFGLFSS